MNAVDLIKRLHKHRAWANQKLLEAAAALDEAQLRASFPIGQGSIWKSLLHLYAAEYVWLNAVRGHPDALTPGDLRGRIPGNQEGAGGARDLADLKARWSVLEAEWSSFFESLTPAMLEQPVSRITQSGGEPKAISTFMCDVFMHTATHAHYTAAQVVNMLRHLGVRDLPNVMLITLARGERAAGAAPGGSR